MSELRSCSGVSSCSSTQRVQDWLNRNVTPAIEIKDDIEHVEPDAATANSVNEVLCHAFKALQNRHVKDQPKDLPTFSGNIMDWPIFENEFKTSTAEFKLTDRENLRRLNNALQGKARKTVECLLSASENVGLIMRMLKSNFGRTEWVVANRLELLRNLDYVKEGNIESFRVFYNAVIGTAVALKNVNAEAYLMNPELISHLAEKLPAFSKQMWVRHKAFLMKQDTIVDFQEFSRWLEDEMENQLASMNPLFLNKKDRKDIPFARSKPPVLNVNTRTADQRGQCPLCSSNDHLSLVKCEQFVKLSVEQRRSAARSCKVCCVCLKQDHSRSDCRSNKSCSVCNKNHHELVHSDKEYRKSVRKFGKKEPEDICHVSGRNEKTLLRVGKVRIRSQGRVQDVFALFDEGSSISMIDTELADKMDLHGPVSPVTYRWTNGITHQDSRSMLLSF
ncbi:uncharacterized protein LOC134290458 [Aedes albopictus]|uniref:Peptidase aspartic putative domain-containing protein n=1 Tax=Aedes albopictus TaxID=7160 RepID=A0ABM1Z2N0_AEDAL